MDESYFSCISSSIYSSFLFFVFFLWCVALSFVAGSDIVQVRFVVTHKQRDQYQPIQFNLQSHVYAIEYQTFVCFVFLFDVFVAALAVVVVVFVVVCRVTTRVTFFFFSSFTLSSFFLRFAFRFVRRSARRDVYGERNVCNCGRL